MLNGYLIQCQRWTWTKKCFFFSTSPSPPPISLLWHVWTTTSSCLHMRLQWPTDASFIVFLVCRTCIRGSEILPQIFQSLDRPFVLQKQVTHLEVKFGSYWLLPFSRLFYHTCSVWGIKKERSSATSFKYDCAWTSVFKLAIQNLNCDTLAGDGRS